jgi:POT family proton-dependent oligopeptide transporter
VIVSSQPTTIEPPGRGSGEFLGHPKGLFVLFSTELWERFSFYAMRGVLTLYMVGVVLAHLGEKAAGGRADQIYGAYLGFVYSATFIGGMLADRLLGQRRAIYIGGFLMSLAQFTLMTHALLTSAGRTGAFLEPMFFLGLSLLACGNGFFKPNISTIVGTLYTTSDRRRDSAFTIFYVGINIGAALSSFASGAGQRWGWYIGYALAGAGMIVSLVIFAAGRRWITGRGLPPVGARLLGRGRFGVPNIVPLVLGVVVFVPVAAYLISHPEWVQSLALWLGIGILFYLTWEAARTALAAGQRMTIHAVAILGALSGFLALAFLKLAGAGALESAATLPAPLLQRLAVGLLVLAGLALAYLMVRSSRSEEGGRIVVIVVLCAFSMVFWGFFELAGSTLQRFVNEKTNLVMLGMKFEAAFINNFINPTLIVIMGVFFSAMWVWLDRRRLEPSAPVKFALGMFQLGLGFLVFWVAAAQAGPDGKSSMLWIVLAYFVITSGELCLSPIGLSMITKLAPARLVGMFMGVWFLSSAIANVLSGGTIGPLTEHYGFGPVFLGVAGIAGGAAVLLFLISPLLKRGMHGIK